MKTKENVGFKVSGLNIKEKVKKGKMTAREGFDFLINHAMETGGANGVAVFRGSKSAQWLSRRIKGIPMGKQKLPLARK